MYGDLPEPCGLYQHSLPKTCAQDHARGSPGSDAGRDDVCTGVLSHVRVQQQQYYPDYGHLATNKTECYRNGVDDCWTVGFKILSHDYKK